MTIGPDLEMQREMVRLYTVEDLPARAIGRRMFWSEGVVRKVLRSHGVQIRRRGADVPDANPWKRYTTEQEQSVCEAYRSGLSTDEIARRMDGSATTIRAILRRNDVCIRSKKEACRLGRIRAVAHDNALTASQQRTLVFLDDRGSYSTTRIARLTGRTVMDTSRTLKQLARLGLVSMDGIGAGRGRPRTWSRTGLALRDVLDAQVNARVNRGNGDTMLPVGPFRDWVEGLIADARREAIHLAVTSTPRHGGSNGSDGIPAITTVAAMLGLSERRVWALTHEQDHVSLTIADRALQNYPGPVRLWDLWPELGESEAA